MQNCYFEFQGIKDASILLNGNNVFVGDNNSGKSTIFEALDLVMGPDRLAKHPVINEHDFYVGEYMQDGAPVKITIEVVVANLNEEQLRHFANNIEQWNTTTKSLLEGPPAGATNNENVIPALRLTFIGNYDPEEDDFVGQTFLLLL